MTVFFGWFFYEGLFFAHFYIFLLFKHFYQKSKFGNYPFMSKVTGILSMGTETYFGA